jgi:hypothetical protein
MQMWTRNVISNIFNGDIISTEQLWLICMSSVLVNFTVSTLSLSKSFRCVRYCFPHLTSISAMISLGSGLCAISKNVHALPSVSSYIAVQNTLSDDKICTLSYEKFSHCIDNIRILIQKLLTSRTSQFGLPFDRKSIATYLPADSLGFQINLICSILVEYLARKSRGHAKQFYWLKFIIVARLQYVCGMKPSS